ncbi:MAG: class D sortase [Thermoanaerobaculia bacterium]
MNPGGVARWLRRGELALGALGLFLLGGALATIVSSRIYQARQGRAFSELDRLASRPVLLPPSPAGVAAPASSPPPPVGDPLLVGRIEIPRIGVSAMIREGEDDATLAVSVGRIPGTARPGERGNMALAGHRDTFFRGLRLIRVDDVIHVRVPGRRYDYRVESTEVVGPREIRVLDPTAEAVLTLVTCFPFEYVGNAPNRFIVRASRLAD